MSRDGAYLGLLLAIPFVCFLLFRLIKSEKYNEGLLEKIPPMALAVFAAFALAAPKLYLAQKMLKENVDIVSILLLLAFFATDAVCLFLGKHLEKVKGQESLGG